MYWIEFLMERPSTTDHWTLLSGSLQLQIVIVIRHRALHHLILAQSIPVHIVKVLVKLLEKVVWQLMEMTLKFIVQLADEVIIVQRDIAM